MIDSEFVQVAVEAPLPHLLTYRLPKDLAGLIAAGTRVQVPLGKRKSKGVLIGPLADLAKDAGLEAEQIKTIDGVLDEPAIGSKTLRWLRWLAQYYLHPPGQVYSLAFAPGTELRKRKSKKVSPTEIDFENFAGAAGKMVPNEAQAKAIKTVVEAAAKNVFDVFLLFGITGSGKTEVYLQAIEETLAVGKQVLVLVPEISLTPQLTQRFMNRFGDRVAVLHSHLTTRERADQWWSAVRGKKQILVGARSALFCPLENLGLLVVDEEHEGSFKQEEQLKYNARDAAIMRAQFSSCPIVLGSATPSLESWHNVASGKYKLLELPARVENRPLPKVEILDMRVVKQDAKDQHRYDLPFWLSPRLHELVKKTLDDKDQCALFLNRRGFAQFLICSGCGWTEQCPHCSVTLTVHAKGTRLDCHYCGFKKKAPIICPSCNLHNIRPLGLGTEKVAEEIQNLFPEARIARADRDEINTREGLENLLIKIQKREVDIIVGTQMIAKGHDFPDLTLVGCILADVGLHMPDFRSSERTFQLLTQVAGRAGRHQKEGRVVIQTYVPGHPAVLCAADHDFRKFAEAELKIRQELLYPPFGKLATIRIQGTQLDRVEHDSEELKQSLHLLQKRFADYENIEILGPCEAPLAKLKGKHRFHLLLKGPSAKTLNVFLQHVLKNAEGRQSSGVRLSIDMDPLQLL